MRAKILIGLIIAGVLLAFAGRHFWFRLYNGYVPTFFPGTRRAAPPQPHGPGIEVLRATVDGASVESLFLPATDAAPGAKPLVIFAHGNSALIDDFLTALNGFRERGIGVLLVEYPGFGRSTGTPTAASIRAALDAAYDRIVTDARVDASRIIGFGQSFGGAAICLLSRDRSLRALILMSTFTSTRHWVGSGTEGTFDSVQALSHYQGPVLVIHGRDDPRIPWQQGKLLSEAAPHSIFKLYECGHDCWQPDRVPFWQDAAPFLAQAGIVLRAPP